MKELENPFVVYGYVSPTYFCDREQETCDLITALSNGRNVTLMSPRRMGKTGLIRYLQHNLQHLKLFSKKIHLRGKHSKHYTSRVS